MQKRVISLLSTDFDGTLIGFAGAQKCVLELAEALIEHKRTGGLWAVNTGRSLTHTLEGLDRLDAPVEPDFLLTNEREVHRSARGEWEPHGKWNEQCCRQHDELYQSAREIFEAVHLSYSAHPCVNLIHEGGRLAGLVADSERMMDRIVDELGEITRHQPDFSFQRNTIYLRFCHADYDKGSALAELCRLEGIPRSEVLAIGDNHNDIPMLRRHRADMVACPANSIDQVRRVVAEESGYIATADFGRGVAEAWRHFLTHTGCPTSPRNCGSSQKVNSDPNGIVAG